MKHDDLDGIVEAIKEIDSRMSETGRKMEIRDAKHHTGSSAWLISFNSLMRA